MSVPSCIVNSPDVTALNCDNGAVIAAPKIIGADAVSAQRAKLIFCGFVMFLEIHPK
ncbi:hypothetical protein LMG10661_03470 [Ralstonia syzygii subsp. syzygii]|nr:hypothetical protein LMG10661_03470 [Ralstonia syzygii subsp. syzygii]